MTEDIIKAVETLNKGVSDTSAFLKRVLGYKESALAYNDLIDVATLFEQHKTVLNIFKEVCRYLSSLYVMRSGIAGLKALVIKNLQGMEAREAMDKIQSSAGMITDLIEALSAQRSSYEHHIKFCNSAEYTLHGGKL